MAAKGSEDPAAGIAAAAANPLPAPELADAISDGPAAAADDFDVKALPDDAPIAALGFLKQKFYFLDFDCQLIELGSEFRKGELMALFGTRMGWLDDYWPQWKKVGEKMGDDGAMVPVFAKDKDKGFNQAQAQRGLIMSCSRRGLFDPKGKVRGRGAHRGGDGELVLHCGDYVIVGGRKGVKGRDRGASGHKPGLVGGYVYPRLSPLPRPDEHPASAATCQQILVHLESWNWARGRIAAYLLFCWIAAACMGGALKNRPGCWIVGPSGAGKTTLQEYMRLLIGDWGVFTEDATEAGVRQLLDQDTLAVMFDEIEAEADNHEVVSKIIRLMRLAYSGASSLRGSADHQAKQFVARSCFLFSSIHHHEMPAQDRNRMAILKLSKFPADTPKFIIPELTKEWGDQLRRRLLLQWPRFDATLATYQAEMLRQGYTGREQDTYGTLLACGDLLLNDAAPPDSINAALNGDGGDRVHAFVRSLGGLVDAARSEAEDSTERCLKHLASHRLPASAGAAQETVSRWLQKHLIALHKKFDGKPTRLKLGSHGLRVVHLAEGHESGQGGLVEAFDADHKRVRMFVAIANKTNKGVEEIFAGSMWAKGVWQQSLSLADGAWHNKKSRFGGGPAEGCVLVPLDALIDVAAAIEEANQVEPDGRA